MKLWQPLNGRIPTKKTLPRNCVVTKRVRLSREDLQVVELDRGTASRAFQPIQRALFPQLARLCVHRGDLYGGRELLVLWSWNLGFPDGLVHLKRILVFNPEPKGDLLINIVKSIFNCKKNSGTGRRCNWPHRVCLRIVDQRTGSLFPRQGYFGIHNGTFKPHNWVHRVCLRVIYQGASFLLTYLGKFLRLHASIIEVL